jgi:1-deoxy-D-xylulose-5-phosphate synthase
VLSGGFGSAVGEVLAPLGIPVTAMAVPDEFIEQGSQAELLSKLSLDPVGVASRIRSVLADADRIGEKVTHQGS